MNVLVVTSYYKPAYIYGGPVRSIPALVEGLAQQGANVSVITTNAAGSDRLDVPLRTPVSLDGAQVYYFPLVREAFPALGRFFYSPELARACFEMIPHVDVVLLQSLWAHANIAVERACRKAGVPYIISPRSQLMRWGLQHKSLKKSIYMRLLGRPHIDHAAGIHCTAEEEAEDVRALGFKPPIFIVPNAVDTARFANTGAYREAMRQRLGISPEALVLLQSGRLHPKKRPDISVHTLGRLRNAGIDAHLLFAGPDESAMSENIRKQASELGCADRVHLLGLLKGDDILSALGASDLLLMPSEPNSENFGMSALEGAAAGLAVVLTNGIPVGGMLERANAGRTTQAEADAFASAVLQVVQNREEMALMGARGSRMTIEHFSIAAVSRQLYDYLDNILNPQHAHPPDIH